MIINVKDKQFVEKAVKDLEDDRFKGTASTLLEMIYDLGVKEGKAQVVKNAIDFISK